MVLQRPQLLPIAYFLMRWLGPFFRSPVSAVLGYARFFRDFLRYRQLGGVANLSEAYPCLFDRTTTTSIDTQYFYQMIWAGKKIRETLPDTHVDVGSDVKFVGMLSVISKVIFVDIRPLMVDVEGLECREGSILALPFSDHSVFSLSSLHVVEHIGLGRYGDPLDPNGSERACRELSRVLAPGGTLYVSVPVGQPRIQFNGQRVFSVKEILDCFSDLFLVAMAMVDANGKYHSYVDPQYASELACASGRLDYSLGCFVFCRQSA